MTMLGRQSLGTAITMIGVPTVEACCAYPYPHCDRAVAGLRGALRLRLSPGETPDWSTLVVTGPTTTTDGRGNTWYGYAAEVTAAVS
jgi:hypothetical protein